MDELLAKTRNLQVTDEEEWEVDKSLSITIAKCNLRGRLCTTTEHSRGFLKKVLGGIWRLKEAEWNLKIKEKFDTVNSSRILSKMPWYLSNGLLILGKMENSNDSWKHDLTSFPIWGRAMGVPVDLLTTNNTVRMAAKAGESGCRDGFQGNRLSMEKQSAQGDHTHKKTTGLTNGTVVSNSFGPLEDTIGGVEKMIADLEV
ncbi:hypothetical protein F8388_019089 [Cannabis sativa]|uniref:DUF4283 domain-containing protein n=1 Tax=Cannabis sativa TaxID=3483 RepID=A0A7J6FCF0_CANSA|nr:hypothetical protein F8388_019089 [Cannabis sativa]